MGNGSYLITVEYAKNQMVVTTTIRVDDDVYWAMAERAAEIQSDEPWLNLLARLLEIPEIKDGRILPHLHG